MMTIDLDKPIYETVYNVITPQGRVVEAHPNHDIATSRAKELGLRVLKTVREVQE